MALPKNSTAHLQPMDAGIIRNFKLFYRKQLITDYMASLDRGKRFNVDLRKAILMIYDAWGQVKPETIENCFRKTGIIKKFDNEFVNVANFVENEAIIKHHADKLEAILNEEMVVETEKIDDEDIINLFQEKYEINDFVKEAENGNSSSFTKPAQILDAIDVLLSLKMDENKFSELLTPNTINNLKELKRNVEIYRAANTRQSSIREFSTE